jgi:hypothetical protein
MGLQVFGFLLATSILESESIATSPSLSPASKQEVADGHSSSITKTPTSTGVKLVRLRRRSARSFGKNSAGKSFYTAKVFVGHPHSQTLHVALDTASGQIILPDHTCSSQSCVEHRRYQSQYSAIATDVNADGVLEANSTYRDAIHVGFSNLDLGDGAVLGHFLTDVMCLTFSPGITEGVQEKHTEQPSEKNICTHAGLVSAINMTDVPFRAAPYDGIIGLGLQGLSVRPEFNFLERLGTDSIVSQTGAVAEAETPHQFALYHGRRFGEAAFGGYNPKRLASPLSWVPVLKPEDGYWQVHMLSVRIGNKTLDACAKGNCRGIIDSGTSSLGVHSEMMTDFQNSFAAAEHPRRTKECGGPDLHLELAGGVVLTLRASDYMNEQPAATCVPQFKSLELPASFEGVFVFGEPLFRRYYTVFDWKQGDSKIGFGLATVVDDTNEMKSITAAEAADDWEDTKDAIFVNLAGNHVGVLFLVLQGLVIRFIVVTLIMSGSRNAAFRSFLDSIQSFLCRKKFAREVHECTTALPADELPPSDECVICLGCCEDDLKGVPGIQACAVENALPDSDAPKSAGSHPRWLRLRCGHHFHEACIFEWLQKSKQCPVCRRKFNETACECP